ncbi:MAG TPA: hypothetical protein VGP47_10750 [Parachlamydiaceae bacterium]|nr:hypothetical protein [Parachlamydiaceae bacterium]
MKKKLFGAILATGMLFNGASAFADDTEEYIYEEINWTVIDDIPMIIDNNDDTTDLNYEFIQDVAQYKLADWSQAIGRKNGISVTEAKKIADENSEITFFFYTKAFSMILENPNGIRVFDHGDAVFFSGSPLWGSAPGLADGYVKTIAN